MFIFIYGKDTYRSRRKLGEIVIQYQKIHRSGLNFKIYDVQSLDFQKFKNEFQQSSMFKEKKLLILKNAFPDNLFKKDFLKEKKIFLDSEDIIIFFEEGSVLKSDRLAVFLKKNSQSQEFNFLGGKELESWIIGEFKKDGVEIEGNALKKLISFVGTDSWRMANEIKKLIHYEKNPFLEGEGINKSPFKVTQEEVEILVRPKIETEIFKTIDSLAERNKSETFSLIEKHLGKGDSPLYLLSMIGYQFRNLIIVKKNELYFNNPLLISKKTGLTFFQVRKLMELNKKFSLEELKKIFQKIFETDLNIKTGRIGAEQGIKSLVAEI